MIALYEKTARQLNKLQDLPLLFFRLILAYGFYNPAMKKWSDIGAITQWFDSMGLPLPGLNAYLAASAEALGVVLLTLGLGTRIISIPLMVTMLVAIFTVHIGNGFSAGNNGFEIPLYYLIMLVALLLYGSGKISIDYLISKNRNSSQ